MRTLIIAWLWLKKDIIKHNFYLQQQQIFAENVVLCINTAFSYSIVL